MSTPGFEGLHTDQAPPLSIPSSFFLLVPLAMVAAGVLLAWNGNAALGTRGAPLAMAVTHLGTLGVLGSAMLGALYQMTAVVAGSPVPHVRVAHGVHALFAIGVAVLVAGLARASGFLLTLAPVFLCAVLALFLAPVGVALARAPTRSATVWGMRGALGGLAAVGVLGTLMALARSGTVVVHGDWTAWVAAHAALGGVVWVGGLITAVSWQVVPMFYLTPPLAVWSQRATVGAIGAAVLAIPIALFTAGAVLPVAMAVLPAAVMVWWVHPFVTLRALSQRRRRRVDGSVRFWRAGLLTAPLVPVLAVGALVGDDPRWSVALGWVAVWGWAAMIVHGMLTRIVPFLVWFHRYASLAGKQPVPTMRDLFPDSRILVAALLHLCAVLAGLAAIVTQGAILARIAGALVAATGVWLAVNLIRTLAPRRLPEV